MFKIMHIKSEFMVLLPDLSNTKFFFPKFLFHLREHVCLVWHCLFLKHLYALILNNILTSAAQETWQC